MNRSLSRRAFLRTSAVGALSAAGASSGSFAAAKPGLTIIDTHTHFYDPSRPQGVPWPNKNDSLLYRTVLPKEYKQLPAPFPVTGTVVVEASGWVEDNQWILDLAARNPFIVGFVGNLPVGTREFAGHLTRFASNPFFRGLRVSGARIGEGAQDPRFISDLKLLASHDLELDLNGPPASLADVERIAREVPELRIVINHVANLKIDGKAPDPEWVKGMQKAAAHSNVNAKVSGLVEGTGKTDGTAPREVDFYRSVLDAIWSAFGEDRLIYGSNWPVSARFANLATVQGIVSDYFLAKGPGALEKVFSENARRVYKWVRRDPVKG